MALLLKPCEKATAWRKPKCDTKPQHGVNLNHASMHSLIYVCYIKKEKKMRRLLIAGNWKMHKNKAEANAFAQEIKDKISQLSENVDIAICAPFTQLDTIIEALGDERRVLIGAQNAHYEDAGAFTGEISIPMLKEVGVDLVIIGHSERRQYFGETDETVNLKLKRILKEEDINPILCVGESLEIRESGEENSFVESQIVAALKDISAEDAKRITVAYEPIWAIGTGKTASSQQAQDMCKVIRHKISDLYSDAVSDEVIIQYGGSVKPANAKELLSMEDIDGALVGGASLKVEDFVGICTAK